MAHHYVERPISVFGKHPKFGEFTLRLKVKKYDFSMIDFFLILDNALNEKLQYSLTFYKVI